MSRPLIAIPQGIAPAMRRRQPPPLSETPSTAPPMPSPPGRCCNDRDHVRSDPLRTGERGRSGTPGAGSYSGSTSSPAVC